MPSKTLKKRKSYRGGADHIKDLDLDRDSLSPIPDLQFLSKEQILHNIGDWTSINCLSYKNDKSVMIVENNLDTRGVTSCGLFPVFEELPENTLTQFIIYQNKEHIRVLLTPTYVTPEIGTKHRCLLLKIPDESIILGSGEIIRTDSTIFYSCTSSLYFQFIRPHLYPSSITKQEKEELIDNYETDIVKGFLEAVFPASYSIKFVFILKPNGLSQETKARGSSFIVTPSFTPQPLNPESFCSLPKEDQPTCLRYVNSGDCAILENHPEGGYCQAGLDFCENKDAESIPSLEVREEEYIYTVKPDATKAETFLIENGYSKIKGNKQFIICQAKRIAKTLGLTEEQTKAAFYSNQLAWP
jgi:hypothetical protein